MSQVHKCKSLAQLKAFVDSELHTADAKKAGKSRTLYFDLLCIYGDKLSNIMSAFQAYAAIHDYHAFKTVSYCLNHMKYRTETLGWQYSIKSLKNGDYEVKLTGIKSELGKSYKKAGK